MNTTKKLEVIRQLFHEALGKPPFPYQEAILTHPGPLVINKARQTGISTTMACMAVSAAALGDKKVLICSNKEENAKHLLSYAWDFIHPIIPIEGVGKPEIDQAGYIRFKNGGEIRCQAATQDAGRGYPVNLVIMDEFAHFDKEIDLDSRMMRSIRPTLAQTNGRLIVLSTPNGTKNEFYREWDRAPKENRITVHWTDCPTLHIREEILPFGKQYWIGNSPTPMAEADFRQEFCNDFYVGSDQAIPLEALRASLCSSTAVEPTTVNWTSIGEDIGYEHDATAFVAVGRTDSGRVWILEASEMRRTAERQYSFSEFEAALAELKTRRNANWIVIDKMFNPQSTESALKAHPGIVEPFTFSEQGKRDLLAKAASFFTAGLVRCPERYRQVIDELANIKKVIGPSGSPLYKDKPHRDIGWACLLALWGVPTNVLETSAAGMWACESCKGEEPAKTRCGRCGGTGVHVFQF